MSILDKIIQQKRKEVAKERALISLESLQGNAGLLQVKTQGFVAGLKKKAFPAVIAEIKKASPSKGVFRKDLDILQTAKSYEKAGAAAISILTDETFFCGQLDYLSGVRKALPSMPLLRKDFIIDSYQVWQSRAYGADALLLIVSVLSPEVLKQLLGESLATGLDVLLEVHTAEEARVAAEMLEGLGEEHLPLRVALGVNNRDLHSFKTSLSVTKEIKESLGSALSDFLFVSESGILSGSDIQELKSYGADAFLIGESLIKEGDPGANLSKLLSEARS